MLVEGFGKRPMRVGEAEFERLHVVPVTPSSCAACTVSLRGASSAAPNAEFVHEFGAADRHGIVGESPAAWELRGRVAFSAGRDAHVLITGPSGTGKELVARAIHESSARHTRSLVARNASTFPSTLIDAELFGNLANYPNADAGTPRADRAGRFARLCSSTRLASWPADLQAHLLRVLDSGEYQRLGMPGRGFPI